VLGKPSDVMLVRGVYLEKECRLVKLKKNGFGRERGRTYQQFLSQRKNEVFERERPEIQEAGVLLVMNRIRNDFIKIGSPDQVADKSQYSFELP
jgi:hypothetical protein